MKLLTREQWLESAVIALTPIFVKQGYVVPPCRVSYGFASTGAKSAHMCNAGQQSHVKIEALGDWDR
jgi:hypothetical protein